MDKKRPSGSVGALPKRSPPNDNANATTPAIRAAVVVSGWWISLAFAPWRGAVFVGQRTRAGIASAETAARRSLRRAPPVMPRSNPVIPFAGLAAQP